MKDTGWRPVATARGRPAFLATSSSVWMFLVSTPAGDVAVEFENILPVHFVRPLGQGVADFHVFK